MYYKIIKCVTAESRVLKQFKKRFDVHIGLHDVALLFLMHSLSKKGERVTRPALLKHLRLLNKSTNDTNVLYRLVYFESVGYITKEQVPRRLNCINVYSVTPLLVEHLGELEKLFKKVRWDY